MSDEGLILLKIDRYRNIHVDEVIYIIASIIKWNMNYISKIITLTLLKRIKNIIM